MRLPPPLPCNAVYYGKYFHLKLFEILYGTNIQCLREGLYIQKFVLHLSAISILLLVIGLFIKSLPENNRNKKGLKVTYFMTILFLLIISLIPIIGIIIDRITFVRKYGWYGDKNYTDTTLIDLLRKAF